MTITADLPKGAMIYYSLPDVNNPESGEQKIKYEGPFVISKLGSSTIRAWTEDEAGLSTAYPLILNPVVVTLVILIFP